MIHFQPSTPQHLARHNEAAKGSPSLLDRFNAWVVSLTSGSPETPAGPPPAPGQPKGPGSPDGTPVAKGTKAYEAILAELNKKYGPLKNVGYRDVDGDGNYVYREYSDGRIYIQFSGRPAKDPVPPKSSRRKRPGRLAAVGVASGHRWRHGADRRDGVLPHPAQAEGRALERGEDENLAVFQRGLKSPAGFVEHEVVPDRSADEVAHGDVLVRSRGLFLG